VATHLPDEQRRCWRFYSALPNLGIDVFPDQMDFFQVLPSGPGKCIVRGAVFGLPDARPEMRVVRYLSSRINTQVNNEDKWLCGRVQRGLASSSYRPGPCRSSSAGCSNSTTCCAKRFPRCGSPARRSSSPDAPTFSPD
jgi:phenylpropionate dioxygenase-like ring-hydroxylating dioxygenase large terminal subunit